MTKQQFAIAFKAAYFFLTLLFLGLCGKASAHGGVTIEDDQCIIKFGFYKAHFTVYQPITSRDREFCEDLPDSGPTVFVLSYLHDSLAKVPVDLRIIRNVTGLGRFTKWSDLEKIENLESLSVFYQPPVLRPDGVLMVEHDFKKHGDYIGIVTARHPSDNKIYRAVFPFQVGSHRYAYGITALLVIGLVFAQYRFRVVNRLMGAIRGAGKMS